MKFNFVRYSLIKFLQNKHTKKFIYELFVPILESPMSLSCKGVRAQLSEIDIPRIIYIAEIAELLKITSLRL